MASSSESAKVQCETVINFVFLILSISLLRIFLLILLPWRLLVWTLARLFRSDLVELVTGLSAFLVNLDHCEKSIATVAGFFIIDGHVPIEEFRSLVEQRIFRSEKSKNYSRMEQGYTNFLGYTFRKREKCFSIDEHVRVFDYDDICTGTGEIHASDLANILAALLSKPWEWETKSPWELLLLYNFKENEGPETDFSSGSKMLMCFRCHHSVADGYSLIHFFEDLFQCEIRLPLSIKSPLKALPIWKRLLFPVCSLYQFAKLDIENRVEEHDWQIKQPSREYFVTVTRPIPVEKIKQIKNFYGVGYLSVFLAAASVAVTKVMKEAGQVGPKRVKCCLPIVKPNHPGGMTNHAFLQVSLLDTADSINQDLLRSVDKAMRKKSLAPFGSDVYVGLIGKLPKHFFPFVRADVTFGASVFPVPTKPVYFQGFRISGELHTIGTFNAGALISISGFDGNQRVTFSMDKSIVPYEDAFHNLGNYLSQEIETIYCLMQKDKTSSVTDQDNASSVINMT